MDYDGLPRLDPRKRILYKTYEAIEQLRISEPTFMRLRKKLGIEPLKRPKDRAKYYTYDMLMQFVREYYKPESIFKAMKARHIDKLQD